MMSVEGMEREAGVVGGLEEVWASGGDRDC